MSVFRSWWGGVTGKYVLLVARTPKEAAKLAGIRPAELPFKFEEQLAARLPKRPAQLPRGVDAPGIYRNVGGAWVRDEQVKPPPDVEVP